MKPRFTFAFGAASIFADEVRLTCIDAYPDRFAIALGPDEGAGEQSPIVIDLPKKDRAAYERAVATFNTIMDEHWRREAAKNAHRRARAAERNAMQTETTHAP